MATEIELLAQGTCCENMRVKNEKAPYSTTTGRPGKFRIGVHSSEMGKITKKGANLGKSQLLIGANLGKLKPKQTVTIRFISNIYS